SLITTPCLSAHGVDVRMNELSDAINILTATCPELVIYLDAGAADALPAARTASLLGRAGVAKIQGFFLNSTHFDWTAKEIAYHRGVLPGVRADARSQRNFAVAHPNARPAPRHKPRRRRTACVR
ncbi:MAG TPA: hypothetical protein VE650_10660, partial [Acetobacteraceae bacterium]|nr:hypothetical protein [Acetobacteraceae bacterium]